MLYEIKHRFTNNLICSFEAESVSIGIEAKAREGANLEGANLRGANLRGANLSGANLEGEILDKTPLFFSGLIWQITITSRYLTIGCQRHSHEDWESFRDSEIINMEGRALEFWATNKTWILNACKAHRGGV